MSPYRVGRPEIFCSNLCRSIGRRRQVRLYVALYHDRHRGRRRLRHPWEWNFEKNFTEDDELDVDEIRDWEKKIGQSEV
jgi:hypothetical protein